MHERGEAGAEVVQREAHAEPRQAVHGLLHRLAAAHHRGFGELELEPVGLDAALGDQPFEGRQQLAVLELAERQVDRHVHGRQAAPAQPLHVAQGAGHHPVAERHDQAALLGQRDEFVGTEQAAFAVPPAHQRLEADDAPVGQAQPGLVVQFQFVAAQCLAQLALQVGEAARAAVDALVVDMEGAALDALGLLHGDVRVPHQRIGAGAGARMGQAQAAAEQQALAVDQVGFRQRLGEPLAHAFGALRVGAGVEEQGELVAAQARQLVARRQLRLQARHHLEDQAVAGLVAERIVGVAEVVQVEMTEG
ncbi:hypothetical protein D9M69_443410 [compost metagenome]